MKSEKHIFMNYPVGILKRALRTEGRTQTSSHHLQGWCRERLKTNRIHQNSKFHVPTKGSYNDYRSKKQIYEIKHVYESLRTEREN